MDGESLLAAFVYVIVVLFKAQFNVQGESGILEALHHRISFLIDAVGVVLVLINSSFVFVTYSCMSQISNNYTQFN